MKCTKNSAVMIVTTTMAVFLITVILVMTLLHGMTDKMKISANQTLLNSTRVINDGLNQELDSDLRLLNIFSDLISMSGSQEDIQHMLKQYVDSTGFFHALYLDMSGNGIDSAGIAVSLADLPFTDAALSDGKNGSSEVYHGDSGRLQLTFQSPVIQNGDQIGAVYADKAVSRYNSPTLFRFNNGDGKAYVIDGAGKWMIENTGIQTSDIFSYLEQQGNSQEIRQALQDSVITGRTGTVGVQLNGEECFLAFMPVDIPQNWYLISVLPKSVLLQESNDITRMIYMALAALLMAAAVISALLMRQQSLKNREQVQEERERLFRNISANVDFAFLLYSPKNRRVQLVSDNVHLFFDIAPEEAALNPELLLNRCGMPETDPLRTAFLGGTLSDKVQKEYRVGTGAGLQQWFSVHLIPADDEQYLAVLHETTKEHLLRDNLAEALKQAQESSQAKTTFFSAMSHDIRTPMNGITGMTQIAIANIGNQEKVKECLFKIKTASSHLLSLINEVLDMSRIESGKISLKEEPVYLPELISDLLNFVKPDITSRHQSIQVKTAVLEYDTVLSDTLHLQKIILNLMSNATKYTQEGGCISVGIEETSCIDGRINLKFTVADNGAGMSPEFQKRLFTPFEREVDSRTSKAAGTGLGLAITKSIVDMMNGTITVESKPGAGTTFQVMISVPVVEQKAASPIDLTGHTILVADDDPDAGESIHIMLKELGVYSDFVCSGQEAVDGVVHAHNSGNDYLSVILDWKMPGMDGIETARRIRSKMGNDIPIILLSAYNWEEVESEARSAGINGFLTKPLFQTELFNKLRYYVKGTEPVVADQPAVAAEEESFEGVRVLLAEDNDLNRQIAEELFAGKGIQVESVTNGKEAVDRFISRPAGYYDMVFMDIHMPEMDGYTATQKIRGLQTGEAVTIPIIAMTADVFEEDIRRCIRIGMNDHVAKPIDLNIVFDLIRKYKRKSQRGLE